MESALRERRRASGLTQLQLAERSGVSRQLIAAVEAGRNTPAVDAAVRLARALGTSVEALFAATPATRVVPALEEGLRPGRPLRLSRVGDRLVAAELADHGVAGAGWARPDAVLENGELRLFAGADPAGFVLAGCDPAIGIAEAMLQGLGARSLMAVPAPTGAALKALAAETVHAAVVHGPAGGLPDPPVPVFRLHLARWQVGLGHAPRQHPTDVASLLEEGTFVVQRDTEAGSQQAFERALVVAGLAGPPPGRRASGHIDAARSAALLDCAAVTTESAARAFELGFLALESHEVEIWVAEAWSTHPAVESLGDLLSSVGFTERVRQFGGYELTGCGRRISGGPRSH